MFKIEAVDEFFKQIPSDIKEAILVPIKNCVNFSGRSPRAEIFGFLFASAICSLVYAIFALNILFFFFSWSFIILGGIFIGLMYLSLTARRLHDIDKSGWWCFIFIVPYIGVLLWVLLFFAEGTKGANKYGPDPIVKNKKNS